MKKQTKKQIKFVPAVLGWDEYGENIEYVIPKKFSKEFFEEQRKLRELWDIPEQYSPACDVFETRWEKYRQPFSFEKGKRKKTTLYIKEY